MGSDNYVPVSDCGLESILEKKCVSVCADVLRLALLIYICQKLMDVNIILFN